MYLDNFAINLGDIHLSQVDAGTRMSHHPGNDSEHRPKTLSINWLKNHLLPPDRDDQHALFDVFDA